MKKALVLIFLPIILIGCMSGVGFNADKIHINYEPELVSTCFDEATEDIEYTCQVVGSDPNPEDLLVYVLTGEPDGMSISEEGLITWTPTESDTEKKHPFIIEISDGQETRSYENSVFVNRVNDLHKIIFDCNDYATEDLEYFCQIDIEDEEGNPMTFAIDDAPEGMEIDSDGMISWIPTQLDVGDNIIKVVAADAKNVVNQQFRIFVEEVNEPPTIIPTCILTATEEVLYTCDLQADDEEGSALQFEISGNLPTEMRIIEEENKISWLPMEDSECGEFEITIQAIEIDNPTNKDEYTFTLLAETINDAPEFKQTCGLTATEDEEYTCTLEATDEENDDLEFSYVSKPTESTFVDPLFSWTPETASQPQEISFQVTETDPPYLNDIYSFTLVVSEKNDPPTITTTQIPAATEDVLFNFPLDASDEEQDPITFDLIGPPTGMTIDETEGDISWTPDDTQSHTVSTPEFREYTFKVEVTDSKGASNEKEFTIKANRVNDAPTITTTEIPAATEDVLFEFSLAEYVDDEEQNPVNFSLIGPPTGMTIHETEGIISWTPDDTQSHTISTPEFKEHTFTVQIWDFPGFETTETFSIIANREDDPPYFLPAFSCGTLATEHEEYECLLDAEDQEGDALRFEITSSKPSGMTIIETENKIYWKPMTDGECGTFTIEVAAIEEKDPSKRGEYTFTLTANTVNDAPILFTPECDSTAYAMSAYECQLSFEDEEQDATFDLSVDPEPEEGVLSIDENGKITFYKSELHAITTYNIDITLSDGEYTATITDFELTALANPAFGFAMLGNRIKPMQFAYSVVIGDVGQVTTAHDLGISKGYAAGIFRGDIILGARYALDFHPDFPWMNVKEEGQIREEITDPSILPNSWPVILDRTVPDTPTIYNDIKNLAISSDGKIRDGLKWIVPDGSQYNPESESVDEIGPIVSGNAVLKGQMEGESIGCLNISGNLQSGTVEGVIVIDGDLIIRGEICGKGAIYVRRNIYIVDSLTYETSPVKPEKRQDFIDGIEPNGEDNDDDGLIDDLDELYDLKEWESVKQAEEQRQIADPDFEFDKLELYAGGNVIFGNIAMGNAGYNHIRDNLNQESSGTIPEYNDDPSAPDPITGEPDPFYELYTSYYCPDPEAANCKTPDFSVTGEPYRIFQREENCDTYIEPGSECYIDPPEPTPTDDVEYDCVKSGGMRLCVEGYYDDVEQKAYNYDPKGLYAMDGEEGLRDAFIRLWFSYDVYERNIGYDSQRNDYDGGGNNLNYEGRNKYLDKSYKIETAGLLPQGSKKDGYCIFDGKYCFDDTGWIHPDDFSTLAGYGEHIPGAVDCEGVIDLIKYDKDGHDAPNLPEYDPITGQIECKCETGVDKYGDDTCFWVEPEKYVTIDLDDHPIKDTLQCWIVTCMELHKMIQIKCNDGFKPYELKEEPDPILLEDFKSPEVYALLYAEGAVTGFKKSNSNYYDSVGSVCRYSDEPTLPDGEKFMIRDKNIDPEGSLADFGFLDEDRDGITFMGGILANDIYVYTSGGGWYVVNDDRNSIEE